MNGDDHGDGTSEDSALQKYLKRQTAENLTVPNGPDSIPKIESDLTQPQVDLPTTDEAFAPSLTPEASIDLNIADDIADVDGAASPARIQFHPAGFWRRFVALFIDASLLMLIVSPLSYLLPFFVRPDFSLLQAGEFAAFLRAFSVYSSLSLCLTLVTRFFYYGWFYKNKGASPGKLAVHLRVFNTRTGTYLTYGQSFLRECILKPYVSGLITLGIGYLMVGFRSDKKGLHDLVAGTHVVLREVK